jgi:deoxyribonuclease-4
MPAAKRTAKKTRDSTKTSSQLQKSAGSTRATRRPIGAHQSIAGGFCKAVERALETGCDCLQIFTRNVNRWDTKPIDPSEAAAFRAAVATAGISPVVAHNSYLINPASADTALRDKSIEGLVIELERAELLGIPWVVAHPGAAGSSEREDAVVRAAEGFRDALAKTPTLAAGLLIETTAGQGSCLGKTFDEIAAMLAIIDRQGPLKKRIGVCLDTCHVFAAGYPLAPAASLEATLNDFDETIGLERLVVIHANDSKRACGSCVDRHEAIGKGEIGRKAFGLMMQHPRLAHVPIILETPKEGDDGKPDPANDRTNLALLRRLERP